MNYTHINGNFDQNEPRYNGIKLSGATIEKRRQLKHSMDAFTNFRWRGIDAFENFGAFIINKDSLKFYNGSSWKNDYSKPQFDNASSLLAGISFEIQKIDFTIGVYWINEEDYRQLIYWLNPYEINTLEFDFEPNYYYQAKLSSVENGIRYVIGKEGNKNQYYTEMKLSFEVQGPNCAYKKIPYSFDVKSENSKIVINPKINTDYSDSDLNFPFYLNIPISLDKWYDIFENSTNCSILLKAVVKYDLSSAIELFSINLKNLTDGESLEGNRHQIVIRYNSESGLLFLNNGDSSYCLLNQLTTVSNGKKIVDSISSIRHTFAGKFEDPDFDFSKCTIEIECIANASEWDTSRQAIEFLLDDSDIPVSLVTMNARARTNLI